MAATPGNPYAAPRARISDAAPRLSLAARAMRLVAYLGNAFLALLPLVTFFYGSRRQDTGFAILAAYCVAVGVTSCMALAFRDRFSFWAAMCANVLALVFAVALLAYFIARSEPDGWALALVTVPPVLNLLAILLVRRSRGPSDDTLAARR